MAKRVTPEIIQARGKVSRIPKIDAIRKATKYSRFVMKLKMLGFELNMNRPVRLNRPTAAQNMV